MKHTITIGLSSLAIVTATVAATAWWHADGPIGESASTEIALAVPAREVVVHSDPNCGCCGDWAAYLERHGYQVSVVHSDRLFEVKADHSVPANAQSCHTALVDGVVVEGHVPIEAIERYLGLDEKPFGEHSIGIAVPGMPHGSPGMETGRQDDYNVVAFTAAGEQVVFQEVRF
ncbi:MAG: DUF411 domain-containing protein [Saccharospirillum sp.]